MNSLRKTILRIHGSVLLILPIGLTIAATRSRAKGTGIYGFLCENPWGWIGLVQAYLLMSVVGLVLWIGSTQKRARKWDIIGALAHLPPLAVALASWKLLTKQLPRSVAVASLMFHSVGISIELLSAFLPDRRNTSHPVERTLNREEWEQ